MTMTDTTVETTTPELATTLTVSYEAAMRGVGAVLPHASKDAVTAVICAVRVTPEHFVATDRYAIGVYTHHAGIHPETDGVTIPRAAAEWLLKQTPKMLNRDARYLAQDATVTFTADGITIQAGEGAPLALTAFESMATLNFPPVGRLQDGWEPTDEGYGVLLNAAFLARFEKSARAIEFGNRIGSSFVPTIRMENGKRSASRKHAPLRITIGADFTGLLQPNLER